MNPTQSVIIVRGLAVRAYVGVGALERRAPQTVVVDVEIRLRDPSVASDHMSASVNYAAVVRCIEETAIMERAVLLETLAERIASRIHKDERVADVTVTIMKPRKLPNCDAVGVRRTFHNEVPHGDQ
ncbi:MAG: dihydroneopterin aldolase [Dehalococcoidia bacterium]|nr:dihydroneopterin aldolase [Dehalococcoidia bacterium]